MPRFRVGVVSSIFLIVAGLCGLPNARAQTNSGTAKESGHELVHSLRSALKLLVEADHDYKGHRALAAEEVHKALKELGAHHRKESTVGGAATTGSVAARKSTGTAESKDREAQATSDSQLRQAQQILQGALAEMNAHPGAAANVKAAITEINTALSLK